jgi:hypothetical protein
MALDLRRLLRRRPRRLDQQPHKQPLVLLEVQAIELGAESRSYLEREL